MTNFERFDDNSYYLTSDPALGILGTRGSLSQKRHHGRGPTYHKLGSRILYKGSDLNKYLDQNIIEPVNG